MWKWLKDLFRPIRMQDPEFGKMRFLRQTSTWECVAPFAPLGHPVEVLLSGDQDGPTSLQRQKLREVAQRYPRLIEEIRPVLEDVARQEQAPNFVLQLAALSIPEDSESDYDVELTFGDPSGPPQFDVRLSDWQVREIIGPC